VELQKALEQAVADANGGKPKDFLLTEKEYVVLALNREGEALQKALEEHERRAITGRTRSSRAEHKRQAEKARKYLKQLLEASNTTILKERIEELRGEYAEIVKKAISTGQDVPKYVINQYDEFKKAVTSRQRYEKAWNTAFGNNNRAVDRSMKKRRGYKAKRQDGKPLTRQQRKEIADAVDEVQGVIGDLSDIFAYADVTLSHTNGKHPFLSKYAGCYVPATRVVTTGWRSSVDDSAMPQMAHELFHFLDDVAGTATGDAGVTITRGTKVFVTRNYSNLANDTNRGDAETKKLIKLATYYMNDKEGKAMEAIKDIDLNDPSQAKSVRRQAERLRVILGKYWVEPEEVSARLFEQYIAMRVNQPKMKSVYSDYETCPGYWSKDAWQQLEPLVEKEIEKCLRIIREKIAQEQSVA